MPQKRIVTEPAFTIRAAARSAMQGRVGLLAASAVLYSLCLNVPVVLVDHITGFTDAYTKILADYAEMSEAPTYAAMMELSQRFSDIMPLRLPVFIFLLLVPGPLMFGINALWLRVLRRQDASSDIVFSGFSCFGKSTLLHILRSLFMFLWSLLLVIPGIVAFYRYSLTFFLLADNPKMNPLEAMDLSKYYMQDNKLRRFILDLSFLGWLILGVIILLVISNAIISLYPDMSTSAAQLISTVVRAVVMAPILAYNGVASSEFYHRVICKDPHKQELLQQTR